MSTTPRFIPLPRGYTDGNIQGRATAITQRVGRIGPGSQYLTPGYGWCGHCGTTWVFVREHPTRYGNGGRACFPLCEECWGEMTPAERLPYYRELYNAWNDPSYADWADIERVVLEGK